MSKFDKGLNTVRMLKWGTGGDKVLIEVVCLADFPTYEGYDCYGKWISWGAHMSRPATEEEEFNYWKNRAKIAQSKIEDLETNQTRGNIP